MEGMFFIKNCGGRNIGGERMTSIEGHLCWVTGT